MRVRSKKRSFFYRLFSVFGLKKIALFVGRGYSIKGEGLAEEQKRHAPIAFLGFFSAFLLVYFMSNYLINFIVSFLPILGKAFTLSINQDFSTAGKLFQTFPYFARSLFIHVGTNKQLLITLPLSFSFSWIVFKKLTRKFDSLSYGQEGDARLATIQEIKEQYPAVPDLKERFEGIGGIPITHYMKEFYIDRNTVNSIILGTSRSGKGESIVFPFTDILSRAEEQSSLIFNDPKGELYKGSKETLEERGYEVQVLNLETPDQSMSYNPLQLIIDAYVRGDSSSAQMLVDQFTYALFNDPNAGQNKWVYSGAQKLLNGVILALIDYYLEKDDLGKITMYNVAQWIIEMTNRKVIDRVTKKEYTQLDLYFERLPQGHIAKAQYSSFSSMDSKNKGPIQSAVLDNLTIFQGFEAIAKMTSKNSFRLKSVGFPKSLFFQFDRSMYDKIMKVRFLRKGQLLEIETIRPNMAGVVDLNFNLDLHTDDQLEVVFQDKKVTYSITLLEKDGELNRISGDLDELKQCELFYTEKPIAVFMITPDYDPSKNVISSMFVKQLYTTLAQNAGNTRGGKCFRRVHFILDEFGNMPAIESMDNIVTVCLGRNILFDLFLQSYAQLGSVYGNDTAKIIKENCQNHLYIMSLDTDTHEEISKRVGEKTVEKHSTGEQDPLSLDTSKQTNVGSQRILTPYKLSTLMMGEMVVLRLHRENNKRQKIRSYSIFSTKETSMPFRYEYLSEYFDPNRSIEDFNIPSEHKTFDLAANAIDVDDLISESINRSLLLSLEEGLQSEEELLQIDEEAFASVLKRFDTKDLENYREIIKVSIVEDPEESQKIDLIDFLKQAVTEDLKPLFNEEERCAFLQLANFYLNKPYYKDISNLVRLDTE